tara:strand:+ start:110 stop:589 length:480 start_codon:yes stop_codon:yes gene_type:complete
MTEENPLFVIIVAFIVAFFFYKIFTSKKETISNADKLFPKKISKPEIKERYGIIAKFYNNYKTIDYKKISEKKIAQKQMEDLVNIVDKNLAAISAGTENTTYRILVVGMITFKLIKKEQVITVHNNLRELQKIGELLKFDSRLVAALENILNDNVGFKI